jgi:hypothetical protein
MSLWSGPLPTITSPRQTIHNGSLAQIAILLVILPIDESWRVREGTCRPLIA